jgi:dienelactone hydrolase
MQGSRTAGAHPRFSQSETCIETLRNRMDVDIVLAVQARNLTNVDQQKIFAIGYCFGGGSVLELIRSYPNTPGLLGALSSLSPRNSTGLFVLFSIPPHDIFASPSFWSAPGIGGYHAPLTTTGTKATAGNPALVYIFNGAEDPGVPEKDILSFQVVLL